MFCFRWFRFAGFWVRNFRWRGAWFDGFRRNDYFRLFVVNRGSPQIVIPAEAGTQARKVFDFTRVPSLASALHDKGGHKAGPRLARGFGLRVESPQNPAR